MTRSPPGPRQLWEYGRSLTRAVAYATTLAALVTTFAIVAGIATGGGYVRGKQILFVCGWVMMGYATVQLWPSTRGVEENGQPEGGRIMGPRTRLEGLVARLPPIRWTKPPAPEQRMSHEGKIFLASLFVFVLSYLMEAAESP